MIHEVGIMMTNLQKRAIARKQLEESLKDYEEPIKYTRALLLWTRPIEFGVLLLAITALIYYFKDTSISVVTAVFIIIPICLLFNILSQSYQFNVLTKLFPRSTSHEPYLEAIRVLSDIKFSITEHFNDLRTFKKLSPVQFLIQTGIVCMILAFVGTLFSGFTLFIIALYSIILLPGFIYNQHHTLIVSNIAPYVEKLVAIVNDLIKQVSNQLVNKPQAGGINNPAAAAAAAASGSVNNVRNNVDGVANAASQHYSEFRNKKNS
ncbi:hypothetical protein DFA_06551 [Cavenderia fasciculata]|uniref:Reticulon domain-containing protein n=1 Tax=Cavenderia fasciculata TaxID=261658 RepID=F4PJB5_CACFS|nr:uncharacterized protein DFA_06551 [Cavenderia fasciculata]EGG24401.1 hypothetical protein DFA_06551 [Cavenderia fasciculata]|eukprot:XP_004362252.1 hypothetical protein DFA_06551 [Cavenderia fasciculata]